MFLVKQIIDELRHGTRQICTNLPLTLWDMAHAETGRVMVDALREKYNADYDVQNRVRILSSEEVIRFWEYRGRGVHLKDKVLIYEQDGKSGEPVQKYQIDYSQAKDNGIFWVIDEAHIHFSARAWQTTGDNCIYYISQHRKLGDDIWVATQAPKNVESQFRSIAQDYTELVNFKFRRFGLFAMPERIMIREWDGMPTGAAGQVPNAHNLMKIDTKFLGRCYRTEGGSGIAPKGFADMGKKQKRPSVMWLIPVGVLIVLAFFGTIFFGGRVAMNRIFGRGKASIAQATQVATNNAPKHEEAKPPEPPPLPHVEKPTELIKEEQEAVYLTGLSVERHGTNFGKLDIFLSDGRHYTQLDKEVQFVGKDFVLISGQKIGAAPRSRGGSIVVPRDTRENNMQQNINRPPGF